MTSAERPSAAVAIRLADRPLDRDLDLFGLTHRGNVRRDNQDHFLLATVHPQVVVHATSLPAAEGLPLRGERLATIMLVADGVGGGAAGSEASLSLRVLSWARKDKVASWWKWGERLAQGRDARASGGWS